MPPKKKPAASKKATKKKPAQKKTAPKTAAQSKSKSKSSKNNLAGAVFAITGTLSMPRNEIKKLIESNGGKFASSVTKAVTHLIAACEHTAKVIKAKESGVMIVDEEFLQSSVKNGLQAAVSKTKGTGKKKRKQEEAIEEEPPKKKKAPKTTKKNSSKNLKTEVCIKDEGNTPNSGNSSSGADKRIDVMKENLKGISVPKVKAWKVGVPGQPSFSPDYEIIANVVLQVTNIGNNNNKFYALELHESVGINPTKYRLFTHYGRTDDLTTSGHNSGQRENRYYDDLDTTKAAYQKIYREKTAARKGYQPVNLVSSKIGSEKARGRSAGALGAATQAMLEGSPKKDVKMKAPKKNTLNPKVSDLVQYLYSEATNQLTTTVNCEITANGIETPLGILSVEQVEMGEAILEELHDELKKKKPNRTILQTLSGNFYTAIPHKIGRSAAAVAQSVINDLGDLAAKQELCQLMRDMLQVNSKGENVLFYTDKIMEQYEALGCSIEYLPPASKEFKDVTKEIVDSQLRSHGHICTDSKKISGLYKVRRPDEESRFTKTVDNQVLLYHGSRPSNFVGLLSRGILLPKIVVSMGINRTDGGWLGDGIYFGNADTSYGYAWPGKRSTRLILINRVALGKMLDYDKITYGIKKPKPGYDSCHGVAGTQFYDDEYVVYEENQQKIQYLIETR